jgi:nucleotide-binding universal stress UspA family protein
MFNRILVCLDGSKLSEQILPYAEAQALRFGSKVTLLQIATLSSAGLAGAGSSPYVDQMIVEQMQLAEEEAKTYLQKTAEALKAKGLQVDAVVLRGTPAGEIIVDYASKNSIDLIAIATHGHSGLGRIVFGSVADYVLRRSNLPIMVIKPK